MASSSGPLPTVVPRERAGRCSPLALLLLVGSCWNVLTTSTLGRAPGDLKGVCCFNGCERPSGAFEIVRLAAGRLAAEDLRLTGARGDGCWLLLLLLLLGVFEVEFSSA